MTGGRSVLRIEGSQTPLGRAPDTATPEDLRLFQPHQTRTGARAPSINGSVVALRFFFTVTLDRPELARYLTFVPGAAQDPGNLEPGGDQHGLLEAAPGPKYKAALSAALWRWTAGFPKSWR